MTINQKPKLVRFEDSIPETKLIAIIDLDSSDISALQQLKFTESFDDLDRLMYATLSLPSGNRVSLVRHQNSPQSGIEICVKGDRDNIAAILEETLTEIEITSEDLIWIHPECETNIYV